MKTRSVTQGLFGFLLMIFVSTGIAAPNWHLLLFTIPGCSSCIMMREQVIHPLIASGVIGEDQFDEIVQMSDAEWHYVRGLGYRQIRTLKQQYQTSLFPTLVVLDAKGNKIADNMVGVTSVEHYRDQLEKIIERLNKEKPVSK